MIRISWRTGVTGAFSLIYTMLVLQSLWRSTSIIPDLPRLFWEPGMVLVKDCEVKTSAFISMVGSWQLPSWWVFAEKPRRAPWGVVLAAAGCCDPALPASEQQGVANLQNIKDCFFPWILQHICDALTFHKAIGSYRAMGMMLWRCFLEAWHLFYVFARLPKWKTTKLK